MHNPSTALPREPEPRPVCANAMRADALNATPHRDAGDIPPMLFRSECFAEDLVDAYPPQMH